MKTIKVSKTEEYTDGTNTHLVCKGKLVLVESKFNPEDKNQILIARDSKSNIGYVTTLHFPSIGDFVPDVRYNHDAKIIVPIIISEIEEIEVGETIYNNYTKLLEVATKLQIDGGEEDKYFKLLALPEHFSPKHLQQIVDGKLKDGDEVFVECEKEQVMYYPDGAIIGGSNKDAYVKLTNGHIKLFPVKQSVEEAALEYVKQLGISHTREGLKVQDIFIAGANSAKENNKQSVESWGDIFKKARYKINYYADEFIQYLEENYNPPARK